MRVLAEDHAVARALGIRLLGVDDADVIEELVPEAAVKQMQSCVLHTAVVPINRCPILCSFFRDKLLVVMRVAISEEIP